MHRGQTSVLTIPDNDVQMNGGFVDGAQTSGLNLGGELYIENCINNGTISSGIVGRNSTDVENCFYLEGATQTDGGGSASVS